MTTLNSDSQLINSQLNPIQSPEPSTSLEPPEPALAEILKKPNPDPIIPRTQIPPNRPEMFPCVFCNKFHEATLCPSREISHCDLCLRTKNEYLNEYRCGHKACAGCFLQGECTLCDHQYIDCEHCGTKGASLIDCGHRACSNCRFNRKLCKICGCNFCGGCKKNNLVFKCGHQGCDQCMQNDYCFGKGCVKKNLSSKFGIRECYLCKIDRKKVMKMLCGHFLCEKCFKEKIGIAKFVCWDCKDRFAFMKCEKCQMIIKWEPIGITRMKKLCCNILYCPISYKELKNDNSRHYC